jgi:transposase
MSRIMSYSTDYGIRPPRVKRRTRDHELFIRTWEAATSVDEVATRLNLRKGQARVYASEYRKRGVNLKRFAGGRPNIVDVAKLNQIIEQERQAV